MLVKRMRGAHGVLIAVALVTVARSVSIGAQTASSHTTRRAVGWAGLSLLDMAIPVLVIAAIAAWLVQRQRGDRRSSR